MTDRDRPELEALIARSKAIVEAMTPEQRRDMRRQQRRSWIRGEMMLEHPEMTAEQCDALFDKLEAEGQL